MSDIEKFDFQGYEFRVIERDGDPWFVAKDVCWVLGIRTANLARDLDNDEQGVIELMTPGGKQQVKVVNEPGLYSLILRSRKERAREFKRWVTHEVLPTIRKTGGAYIAPESPAASEDPLQLVERALLVAKEERARAEAAEAQVGTLQPRSIGAISAENRSGGQPLWDLKHTLAEKFGVPARDIYKHLRMAGVVEETASGHYRVKPDWTDLLFNTENKVDGKVYQNGAPRVRPGKQAEFISRAAAAYVFRFGSE